MTYEDRLREEYWKELKDDFNESQEWLFNKTADFFLQHHKEFVEGVRKEVEEIRLSPKRIPSERIAEYHAHNDCLNEILDLPILALPISKEEEL